MKKTVILSFLSIALLISQEQINAQTEKGNFLIGGSSSLGFTSYGIKWETDYGSGEQGKFRNLDLTAQSGYFVFNNFAAGLEIPFSYSKEIEDNDYYVSSSIAFIPFVCYYFCKGNLKPFLVAGIGPGWGKEHYSSDNDLKIPTRMLACEIDGGLAVFLNEHISLDFGLGYTNISTKWTDEDSNMNYKTTSSGMGFNIGFTCFFKKKAN
jgi:outer membrane protein